MGVHWNVDQKWQEKRENKKNKNDKIEKNASKKFKNKKKLKILTKKWNFILKKIKKIFEKLKKKTKVQKNTLKKEKFTFKKDIQGHKLDKRQSFTTFTISFRNWKRKKHFNKKILKMETCTTCRWLKIRSIKYNHHPTNIHLTVNDHFYCHQCKQKKLVEKKTH